MKKAQTALEFLGTYVWVIIALATVLGVLAYFILPKTMFGTDMCVVGEGWSCREFEFTLSHVRISLVNNFGSDIQANAQATLKCDNKDRDLNPYAASYVIEKPLTNGEDAWFFFPPLHPEERRARCSLTVEFKKEKSNYLRKAEGSVKYRKITEQGTPPSEFCDGDGSDDDFDGCRDTADHDCGYTEFGTGTCSDDIDNDCDGGTDCYEYSPDQSCMDGGFCP